MTTLMITSAGPALAVPGEIAGENAGVGYESGVTRPNNCGLPPFVGQTSGSQFSVTDTGTYDGVAPAPLGVAAYVGMTEVFIETEPYVISPEGTYADCTLLNPFVEVKAANVSTPAGGSILGGSVTCAGLDGTFTRRAGDVIEFNLTGSCTVVDPNGTSVTGDTTHVILGVMQPCSLFNPLDPDQQIPEECLLFPEAGSYVTWDHTVLPA